MNRGRNARDWGGQVERAVLRGALVLGLVISGGLWYLARGAGVGADLWLPGLVGLTTVGGVSRFGRTRARRRWEAAWDAYASDDREVGAFAPAEDEEELCLAVGR